jgi:hypothetical protein
MRADSLRRIRNGEEVYGAGGRIGHALGRGRVLQDVRADVPGQSMCRAVLHSSLRAAAVRLCAAAVWVRSPGTDGDLRAAPDLAAQLWQRLLPAITDGATACR